MGAIIEEGQPHHLALLGRQEGQRLPHAPVAVGREQDRVGAWSGLRHVGQVDGRVHVGDRQPVAPLRVDAQVAGDGEHPSGGAGAGGVELCGLAPDGEHGLLRQFLGRSAGQAEAQQIGFHPGRKPCEKPRERISVAPLRDRSYQRRRVVLSRLRHAGPRRPKTRPRHPATLRPSGEPQVGRPDRDPSEHMHTTSYGPPTPSDHRPFNTITTGRPPALCRDPNGSFLRSHPEKSTPLS